MLQLHFSNRYEALTQLLLATLGSERAGVFEPVELVVPSRAVEKSLTLALADAVGICANVHCDFLARWLWRKIALLVPGVGENSPFEPQVLAWRIWGVLGDPSFVAPHPRLAAYLHDGDPLLRYELACRLATQVRDYSTYRDDWLEAWAQGREVPQLGPQARADERWQAALYRRIITEQHVNARHPGSAFVATLAGMDGAQARAAGLPRQLHLFALPTLPPQHLRLLGALARLVDVHLYVLNPCRQYWFEVVDPRRLGRLALRGRDQYHEAGNRLLAAWGQQAQSHIGLLLEQDGANVAEDSHFVSSPGPTLLAQLQNSILDLSEPGPGTLTFVPGDRSIEVHDCHSLGRELEVLHDALLELFRNDDALRPNDVLVVLPDLEAAAPLIDAVFGTVPEARSIPYKLTGRARSTANAPARTLLALLSLASSRCAATEVFDLLQQSGVARRFGLDNAALQRVRDWIGESGMRWALDAEHAAAYSAPPQSRHTLADGLERLFLGFALPVDATESGVEGLVPAGSAWGSDARALGAFSSFLAQLGALHRRIAVPQSPAAWRECLVEALDTFVAADAGELDDLNELRRTLDGLAEAMRQGGLVQQVPLAVVQDALTTALEESAHGGVPTGRVTFTSLASLRSLPFAVICVLGLNDGAFPTSARVAEFDLLAQHPRRGDRQRAPDERNLFLDLVLAARQRLYLSYVGRGVRDNAALPPSVLVAELLDTVGAEIAASLLVRHPLQPFARECFAADADPRVRSFDADLGAALASAQETAVSGGLEIDSASAQTPVPSPDDAQEDPADESAADLAQPLFFTAPLAPPPPQWHAVSLEQLADFFANPSRYLLRRRLGVHLHRAEDDLQDEEPFRLDGSAERAIARRLLPRLLQDPQDTAAQALLAGGIEAPGGTTGAVERQRALRELRSFAARVRERLHGAPLAALEAGFDCELAGERWRITATLTDLRSAGLVRWTYARPPDFHALPAADAMRAWLAHLALCLFAPSGVARQTTVVARNGSWHFGAPAQPQTLLAALVAIYRDGLSAPLPFFPRSAWAFVHPDGGLTAARKVWRAHERNPYAESADTAHQLVFRGAGPALDARFAELARQVYGPLLDHCVADG